MGSGTTAQVALQHKRQYLGCELNPDYAELQAQRVASQQREAPLGLLVPAWLMAGAMIYFGLETSVSVGSAASAASMLMAGGK